MSVSAIIIEVSGKVQGVFFRASTKEECDRLGVNGWVKNLPTGNVLIHAEGTDDQLKKLEAWCHQGSPLAEVDSVEVQATLLNSHNTFEIRR